LSSGELAVDGEHAVLARLQRPDGDGVRQGVGSGLVGGEALEDVVELFLGQWDLPVGQDRASAAHHASG